MAARSKYCQLTDIYHTILYTRLRRLTPRGGGGAAVARAGSDDEDQLDREQAGILISAWWLQPLVCTRTLEATK